MIHSRFSDRYAYNRVVRWFFTALPAVAIDVSLLVLIVNGYLLLMSRGAFDRVFFLYLTGIGLCITMASVMFGYARAVGDQDHNGERRLLIFNGELFLHASVCFIVALLLSWLISHLYNWTTGIPYAGGIVIGLFSVGQIFLLLSALNIHRALMNIEKHLRMKTIHNGIAAD